MEENDTIELLMECSSGVKMAVSSIDEVLEKTQSVELKSILSDSKGMHESIGIETDRILGASGHPGKEPNSMAKGMSWMKTNFKLSMEPNDQTVADLITDGCNMGVKSLHRYLNQYQGAGQPAKDITARLIGLEEHLSADVQKFL